MKTTKTHGEINMPKLTKTQQKRLVKEVMAKSKKLFVYAKMRRFGDSGRGNQAYAVGVVSVKDIEAIERITAKWLKRIG